MLRAIKLIKYIRTGIQVNHANKTKNNVNIRGVDAFIVHTSYKHTLLSNNVELRPEESKKVVISTFSISNQFKLRV